MYRNSSCTFRWNEWADYQSTDTDSRSGPGAYRRRLEEQKANQAKPTFALTADVSEAHRQVPVRASDWQQLGCQMHLGSDAFINIVKILGVASTSYHWSRIAAARGRLAQYLMENAGRTWQNHVIGTRCWSSSCSVRRLESSCLGTRQRAETR